MTKPGENGSSDSSIGQMIKKRAKLVIITFVVVVLMALILMLSTEDVSIAPFVYAIF